MSVSKSQFAALEKRYGSLWWHEEPEFWKEPFKNLVFTVLSQNTSSENCSRAYKSLSEKFAITPNAIIKADIRDIKRAIKSGGLYNIKAKRLKELAEAVVEKFNGDLTPLLALPKEKAKQKLLELPGVGNKTADVLLTTRHTYRKVIPIDTHMNRIAKRLGLVKSDAKYDDIQNALMKFIPSKYRERGAGLLWLLAKHTCKPHNPRCYECIIAPLCKSAVKKKLPI